MYRINTICRNYTYRFSRLQPHLYHPLRFVYPLLKQRIKRSFVKSIEANYIESKQFDLYNSPLGVFTSCPSSVSCSLVLSCIAPVFCNSCSPKYNRKGQYNSFGLHIIIRDVCCLTIAFLLLSPLPLFFVVVAISSFIWAYNNRFDQPLDPSRMLRLYHDSSTVVCCLRRYEWFVLLVRPAMCFILSVVRRC